jgi:hypothetical protein
MKLLPLAYIAGASAQSGDYDYGTAVEADRGFDYSYDYDEFGNKKKKNKNTYSGYDNSYGYGSSYGNSGYYYGKAVGSNISVARALNCWPANFDTDNLMYRDATESNPKENFDFGPLHLYGSEKRSKYAGATAIFNTGFEDPPLRSGLGGHYHYGHKHSSSEVNDAPSTWVNYHAARHAGCLYEVPDFLYKSTTWNYQWHLWYYNGYYNTGDKSNAAKKVAANDDGVTYVPNWVHFFNAHVLPSGGGLASVDPGAQTNANSIKLVIANPQYEGLGWLNFVATYKVSGKEVGDNFEEFADTTHETSLASTLDGLDINTYFKINNVDAAPGGNGGQQTQGITGNYYFDAWMGSWELNMDTTDKWATSYTEATSDTTFGTSYVAISSFPHNEQGKDFRFNLRILLAESGTSTRQMYYWYKINTVTITFPHYVGYALYYDGRESNTASGVAVDGGLSVSGATAQGSGLYNVGSNSARDNIIPPLDLGSWYDNSFGAHTASTNLHHRIVGYLSSADGDVCDRSGSSTDCADWCTNPSTNCNIGDATCSNASVEEICSKKFRITGLLNTYSERLGGQRGTYQEIWIQLQYAMARDTKNQANSNLIGNTNDIISSPFPYLHFMAYEITSIAIDCDTTNVDNGNTCGKFVHPTTHDFGWGGR